MSTHELSALTPASFEHLVNALALRVLGAGHTGFGPGPDGGRDGYFQGEAPYPSDAERWSGRWYLQSKFHAPKTSGDEQKWLLAQINDELRAFAAAGSARIWPDVWIVATNVDPSGVPETGVFDSARKLVAAAHPSLAARFHIWGGRKILDLLQDQPSVARQYGHFLTPGHVLSELFDRMQDERAGIEQIIRELIVTALDQDRHARLDHAGADTDHRPGIHEVFVDLPTRTTEFEHEGTVLADLAIAAAGSHAIEDFNLSHPWAKWRRHPHRARVWFLRGGPGQGKSTAGQYFAQIQRAALVLERKLPVLPRQLDLATAIRERAEIAQVWPRAPRIPLHVELKDYAQWFAGRAGSGPRGVLTYLADRLSKRLERSVVAGSLERAMGHRAWFCAFDGLDEVPYDVRDAIAREVCHFLDEVVVRAEADLLALCTSRPQGYSGQFAAIDGPEVVLMRLPPEIALACAIPILKIDRSKLEAEEATQRLKSAMSSGPVADLMQTPLQAQILAVIVRDGDRPPERRWELFHRFYEVIHRREMNRNLPDLRIARVLREEKSLIRAVHNHLGWNLHLRASTAEGAETSLPRDDFRALVTRVAQSRLHGPVDETVDAVMEAATQRLVLINTPEHASHVRFDIRQLQEFFAGEYLWDEIPEGTSAADAVRERLDAIATDVHWREVVHFSLSALVEQNRQTEAIITADVLRRVDGDDEEGTRTLRRRLGIGARVVIRLLADRVLEKDRRKRAWFGSCLEPAAAFTDRDVLATLVSMPEQSQRWVNDLMYQSFLELDWSESMGAAAILLTALPDEDDRLADLKLRLLNAPTPYLCALVGCLPSTSPDGDAPPTGRAWELAMAALRRRDSLQASGARAVIEYLARCESSVPASGINQTLRKIVRLLAPKGDVFPEEFALKQIAIEFPWGTFHGYSPQAIISTYAATAARLLIDIDEDLLNSTSFIGLAAQIVRFIAHQERGAFVSALSLLAKANVGWSPVWRMGKVLRCIWGGLPHISSPRAIVADLSKMNEREFQTKWAAGCVGDNNIGLAIESFTHDSRSAPDAQSSRVSEYQEFARLWPAVAISLWIAAISDADAAARRGWNDRALEECCGTLLELVRDSPSSFLAFISDWGVVLPAFGEAAEAIRPVLVCAAQDECIEFDNTGDPEILSDARFAFQPRLPAEAALLVPLVNALLMSDAPFEDDDVKTTSDRAAFQAAVRRSVPHFQRLIEIADSDGHRPAARAAAVLLALTHPEGRLDVALDRAALLVRWSTDDSVGALVAAMMLVAGVLELNNQPVFRQLLSRLLDATRGRFENLAEMDSMFAMWREQSARASIP